MIDRSIDLITPFCVQQTYEGQIDENFGIKSNQTEVASEILSSKWKPEPGKPTTNIIKLTNDDIIFKDIRNSYFGSLGFYI